MDEDAFFIDEVMTVYRSLRPYLRHIGNCGAIENSDPMDSRCICGLRQTIIDECLED